MGGCTLGSTFKGVCRRSPMSVRRHLTDRVTHMRGGCPGPLSRRRLFTLFSRFHCVIPRKDPVAKVNGSFRVTSLSGYFMVKLSKSTSSCNTVVQVSRRRIRLVGHHNNINRSLSRVHPGKSPIGGSTLASAKLIPFVRHCSGSAHRITRSNHHNTLVLDISVGRPSSRSFVSTGVARKGIAKTGISIGVSSRFVRTMVGKAPCGRRCPVSSSRPAGIGRVGTTRL